MASNQLATSNGIRRGRLHIWRLLVLIAVLAGVLTALLLIATSAV